MRLLREGPEGRPTEEAPFRRRRRRRRRKRKGGIRADPESQGDYLRRRCVEKRRRKRKRRKG